MMLLAPAGAVLGGMVAVLMGAGGPLAPLIVVASAVACIAILQHPWIAPAILMAMLPFGAVRLPGLPLRLSAAAALVSLLIVVLLRLHARIDMIVWRPPMLWVFILLVMAVVSAASAADVEAAVGEVALLVSGIAIMLLVPSAVGRAHQWRHLVWIYAVVAALTAGAALLNMGDMQARASASTVSGRAVGVFTSPNQLGTLAAIALMLALGCWVAARSRLGRATAVVTITLSALSLAMSLSRGAWIGAALGAAALAVLLHGRHGAYRQVAVVFLGGVGLLLIFQPTGDSLDIVVARYETLVDRQENPYDDRPAIYQEGIRQVVDRPLLGHGPGSFPIASRRAGSEIPTVGAYHAHNVLLTVAAETGLLAAISVVAFTISLGRYAWSRHQVPGTSSASDYYDRPLHAGVAAALVTVVGQGMVDYTFRNPILFSAVWLLVGLVLSPPHRSSKRGPRFSTDALGLRPSH